jgi:DUF1016 N-terminal domain
MDTSLIRRPDGYDEFLQDLKQRIRTAQLKAVFAVNRELILLYWQIGREILERPRRARWGAKVINGLPQTCIASFPAPRASPEPICSICVRLRRRGPRNHLSQQVVGPIPWGHNVRILDLVKTSQEG